MQIRVIGEKRRNRLTLFSIIAMILAIIFAVFVGSLFLIIILWIMIPLMALTLLFYIFGKLKIRKFR